MRQALTGQNALNGGCAGQRGDVPLVQLTANHSCPNQAVRCRLEALTQRAHQLLEVGRGDRGDSLWCSRLIAEGGMRIAPKSGPPLVEPPGRALQILTNRSAPFAAQAAAHRFPAQLLFCRAHGASSSRTEKCRTKRARCGDHSSVLEYARCSDCSNAHDVLTIET